MTEPTRRNGPSQPEFNGYAKLPEELFPKLTQCSAPEVKLFTLLTLKANRFREPRGVVEANIANIANIWMRTSPGAVRRYLKRLDTAGLIQYVYRPAPGGGGIRVIHLMDHCDPSVDHSDPDQGDPGSDHGDPPPDQGDPIMDHSDPIADQGDPISDANPNVSFGVEPPKRSRGSRGSSRGVEENQGARPSDAGNKIPPGVSWNKTTGKVELTVEFRRWLAKHLGGISKEEGLATELSKQEAQKSWGRLNGHILRNRYKTGDSLPAIVVNWFENDLRDKALRSSQQGDEPASWKAIREHKELEERHGNDRRD